MKIKRFNESINSVDKVVIKDEDNEKLSILHYNIKGEDIEFKFSTKKLISAEEYEMLRDANKYNL